MNTPTPTPTKPVAPAPPPAPAAPNPKLTTTSTASGAPMAAVQADIASDVTAVKGALVNVAAQARTEYDALSVGAKAKIHTLLNDLEVMENSGKGVVLAGMHSLFGEKPPTVAK